MKLIEKSALVAEIEKFIERAKAERVLHPKTILAAKNYLLIEDYNKLLSFINTLEVKEVDLDKEIEEHALCMPMSEFTNDGEIDDYLDWARKEFRHFYELGLRAQKGE
jgi:hypothetical protein